MDDDLTNLGLIDEGAIVLDEAALALALPDNPETYLDPYQSILEEIANRLSALASEATTPFEQADALSLVLNGDFGFIGDRETYDDPANADMIRVLDRRRGLPVSLAILYVSAARRMGWTANVLDVPGHVLVLVGAPPEAVMVDPFHGGTIVSPEQLMMLISASSTPPKSGTLQVAAMSNRGVLARLLLNQANRAEESGKGRRALELYRRINAFAPDFGHAWWQRARLELVDHEVAEARKSLTAMLEVTREPAARERVAATLRSLIPS